MCGGKVSLNENLLGNDRRPDGLAVFVCPRVPDVVSGENIMNSKTDEGSPTHPPNSESPPQKMLFKWNHEQGETLEQLAKRVVKESLAAWLKPGPFNPSPQNPN